MHHILRSSTRSVLCLPVPSPWGCLQLVHQCWPVSSLVLNFNHQRGNSHRWRVWILSFHLPNGLFNLSDNHNHCCTCHHHHYLLHFHSMHPRINLPAGLQRLRLRLSGCLSLYDQLLRDVLCSFWSGRWLRLRLPFHLWRSHPPELCRVGLRRGAPGQILVLNQVCQYFISLSYPNCFYVFR